VSVDNCAALSFAEPIQEARRIPTDAMTFRKVVMARTPYLPSILPSEAATRHRLFVHTAWTRILQAEEIVHMLPQDIAQQMRIHKGLILTEQFAIK
jgi:hypothetical protein